MVLRRLWFVLGLGGTLAGVAVAQEPKPGWSGNLSLNANLAQSTQDAQSIFVDGRATQRLVGGGLFDFTGLYILTRQTSGPDKVFSTTEDRWQVLGRYDTPTNGMRFGYITQSFERNRIVNLSLRSVTSAGLGLVLVRTENVRKTGKVERPGDTEWRFNAGVSYLTENYLENLGSREQYGLQFSSTLTKVFKKGVEISHFLNFIPAFENASDYVLFSNLSVSIPINPRTRLGLNYIFDFDTTPAPGARRDNYKYALTLGYRF